mgnify:CR=1 FL=1
MDEPGTERRRKPRWGTLALVVLLHVLALLGLARAFAPDFTAQVVRQAASVLTVTITAPNEEETPPPEPEPDEGTAGEEGRKATPRETAAPKPKIPVRQDPPSPRVTSTGAETQSGARETGEGTGGISAGEGTGSGRSGRGQGNGARKLEKIAGDINSARDYPKKTRDLRIGHSVTILLTVGPDGLVTDCRVTEPSPDAEADGITCRLASQRFRFRPAANARGEPIVGRYAWRQRWFY